MCGKDESVGPVGCRASRGQKSPNAGQDSPQSLTHVRYFVTSAPKATLHAPPRSVRDVLQDLSYFSRLVFLCGLHLVTVC
jgi:hypothetical protein